MDQKILWLVLAGVIAVSWVGKAVAQRSKAQEAQRAFCKGEAVLLDVRTEGEFSDGHIEGALNIPVQALQGKVQSVKNALKQKGAQKVWIYCRSGARASAAEQMLKRAGLDAVSFGGMGNWPTSKACPD